ncbi:MAG: 16S rRNA (cytidine(1402)-2'-O)-methyltransferase [Deltaproteobacteria bacterium]|nr:16S rRNA (cytidine(1402)-2'-O)-methyltransferase [Deltaproteobacteria bacterium]
MAGTLYLVATPLGNLSDVSFRAIDTLKSVAAVVAEDTRRARILCERYAVTRPLVSMPAFREGAQAAALVARLAAGDDLALVTDAGSPGISDPGSTLVARAVEAGVRVVPIPGPSAVVAALSASGLPSDRFFFAGFLPRKGTGRERALSQLKRLDATLVLYESPERLVETLRDLAEAFGDRRACVARELTKIHEELVRGRLGELAARFEGEVRGEITLVVEGAAEEASVAAGDDAILAEAARRLAAGEGSVKEIAREIAQATGRPRSEVYALALRARGER